jgi:small basic protein (TIGR04137 family)
MSMDASLKAANALIRHRNVLTRAERIEKLKDEEKWTDAESVFGLRKVGHRKAVAAAKVKAVVAEGAAAGTTVAGAAPAAAAGAGKPGAAPAKAAAPAAATKTAPPAKGKK